MAEEVRKVPLKPIRAWEETRPPRRKSPRKSPQQQQELCVPQPFHADSPSPGNASCFMGPDLQEKETLDYINTFLKGSEQRRRPRNLNSWIVSSPSAGPPSRGTQNKSGSFSLQSPPCGEDKAGALDTVKPTAGRPVCRGHVLQALRFAPQSEPYGSSEPGWHFPTLSPQELIDLESVDSLTSGVRQQAMLAIMELSKVKPLLRGMELSSLLTVCFSSVFSLPPAETNQGMEAALYNNTLNTMDELLKALVCEDEKRNLVVLQNIVEVLLPWTTFKEVHVRLRAVGRITWLTKFISGQHKFKVVPGTLWHQLLPGCQMKTPCSGCSG
ncbi:unnamed protein product, partial [Lepidochelys kempii]